MAETVESKANTKNPASLFSLKGKVAVVTGGGRGIGRAIAAGLRDSGASVAVLDVTAGNPDAEQEGVKLYHCDVTSEASVDDALKKVANDLGMTDILINNAGINVLGPAVTYPTATWQKILDINLTGAFLCARHVGVVTLAGFALRIGRRRLGGCAHIPVNGLCNRAQSAIGKLVSRE